MDDFENNILSMLRDRKYRFDDINDIDFLIINVDEEDIFGKKNIGGEVSVEKILKIHQKKNHIIIITDDINRWAKTCKNEWWKPSKICEIFDIDFFAVNPTSHYLSQPIERILDTKPLFEAYNIRVPEKEWALITTFDPIARWYDLRHGNMIKIKRYDGIDYAFIIKSYREEIEDSLTIIYE